MNMWVYRRSRDGNNYLFTVGYWVPASGSDDGGTVWESVQDFNNENEARALVHYLNGGPPVIITAEIKA
jgi:hypothetical protein